MLFERSDHPSRRYFHPLRKLQDMVNSIWREPLDANFTRANPTTTTYNGASSSHMALGGKAHPTTRNCVPQNFTSIPETIPPICRPSTLSVLELTLDRSHRQNSAPYRQSSDSEISLHYHQSSDSEFSAPYRQLADSEISASNRQLRDSEISAPYRQSRDSEFSAPYRQLADSEISAPNRQLRDSEISAPYRQSSDSETSAPYCKSSDSEISATYSKLSDSGISATSLSPEPVDSSGFQQPQVQNNMGQMPYFANPHGNPNCAQFYPQNSSFLTYDPNVVNYSAVLQNDMMGHRPRSPLKRPASFKIKKCRRPKRKSTRSPCENLQRHLANDRERTRTKRLNDAFANLRKMIPCRPSDKLSKIQTLRLAVLYIDFLLMCLQQDSYFDPRSFTLSSVRDKLSKDFSYWRLKREGKRLAKLM